MIPSTANMPASKFANPVNFGAVKANTAFTIQMKIARMQTGNFVNAQENYFAAPQQLNGAGQIIGHTHVVVEKINSFADTTVPDPNVFAFFKGINGAAVNGVVTADVTDGLAAGIYRMCSINAAANHQPAIVPVAQHGNIDDCVYFSSTNDGQPDPSTPVIGGGAANLASSSAIASATVSGSASATASGVPSASVTGSLSAIPSGSAAVTGSVSASASAVVTGSASAALPVSSTTNGRGGRGGKGGKGDAGTAASSSAAAESSAAASGSVDAAPAATSSAPSRGGKGQGGKGAGASASPAVTGAATATAPADGAAATTAASPRGGRGSKDSKDTTTDAGATIADDATTDNTTSNSEKGRNPKDRRLVQSRFFRR
jgi:hypothetical protein